MLAKLLVKNYILIDNLEIDFDRHFSAMTGETGSGKSILLGALGLVLGNRAEINTLKSQENKCIIEAHFDISKYELKSIFEENEIDYDAHTILRREITPQGKSRAFINDIPVNLNILKEIGEKLIDIHSQYQTLHLSTRTFQLELVDAVAKNNESLKFYKKEWQQLIEIRKNIELLKNKNNELQSKYDFLSFQLSQLKAAKLKNGELEDLEHEQKQLNNRELIAGNLVFAQEIINNDDSGIASNLSKLSNTIHTLAEFLTQAEDWTARIDAARIDIADILRDIDRQANSSEYDPERLHTINSRISIIYDLLHKHHKQTVEELIEMQAQFETEISNVELFEEKLIAFSNQEKTKVESLQKTGDKISKARQLVFENITKSVISTLQQLGMPAVKFKIEHKQTEIGPDGIDDIRFLFSSNKQIEPNEIGKIASGGELSRLMLSLKAIMSKHLSLPTIIFDEIDTGVSGDIADKMAKIMLQMSQNMQVISITHLPQIAAKAHSQYYVYKETSENASITKIKLLTYNERTLEIARMLSGEKLSDAAIANARELLTDNKK